MFGWEFPPHIAGGLGTACYGMTRGLARNDVEVIFVVPRAYGDEDQRFARVVKMCIRDRGAQEATYEAQNFYKLPISPVRDADGNWVSVSIAFPGRTLSARVWLCQVGRTDLYLLDADFEANLEEDRQITYYLYGGDWENRLKQEILLGIGGIRALRALNIRQDVYHCNEGHAAFIGIDRILSLIHI